MRNGVGIRRTGAIALAIVLACQSTKSGDSIEESHTRIRDEGYVDVDLTTRRVSYAHPVPFPAAQVWNVLPDIYQQHGLPVTRLDPTARVIAAEGFEVRRRLGDEPLSRIVDCGRTTAGVNANTYTVWLRIVTKIVPIDSGSASVSTEITGSAADPALGPMTAGRVSCTSVGRLEERLAIALRASLLARP